MSRQWVSVHIQYKCLWLCDVMCLIHKTLWHMTSHNWKHLYCAVVSWYPFMGSYHIMSTTSCQLIYQIFQMFIQTGVYYKSYTHISNMDNTEDCMAIWIIQSYNLTCEISGGISLTSNHRNLRITVFFFFLSNCNHDQLQVVYLIKPWRQLIILNKIVPI